MTSRDQRHNSLTLTSRALGSSVPRTEILGAEIPSAKAWGRNLERIITALVQTAYRQGQGSTWSAPPWRPPSAGCPGCCRSPPRRGTASPRTACTHLSTLSGVLSNTRPVVAEIFRAVVIDDGFGRINLVHEVQHCVNIQCKGLEGDIFLIAALLCADRMSEKY